MFGLVILDVLGVGLCLFVGVGSQADLLLRMHAGGALCTALLFPGLRRDGSIVLLVV